MAIVFLSDIHLSARAPAITEAFLKTLAAFCAQPPEAVFILGDLFDLWCGDRAADAFAWEIAAQLRALTRYCPVFFQRGNRDFLLGKRFLAASGMTLLPDRYLFDYRKQRILLEHGDLLCSDDKTYQRLRRILRSALLIHCVDKLPIFISVFVGRFLRQKSQRKTAQKSPQIMDVNADTVQLLMQRYGADVLIHGHTHRPAVHDLAAGKQRIVLGNWRPHGEILQWNQARQLTIFHV